MRPCWDLAPVHPAAARKGVEPIWPGRETGDLTGSRTVQNGGVPGTRTQLSFLARNARMPCPYPANVGAHRSAERCIVKRLGGVSSHHAHVLVGSERIELSLAG